MVFIAVDLLWIGGVREEVESLGDEVKYHVFALIFLDQSVRNIRLLTRQRQPACTYRQNNDLAVLTFDIDSCAVKRSEIGLSRSRKNGCKRDAQCCDETF